MSWASGHIAALKNGQTVSFRPKGNSMSGKIESGQLVTVIPASQVRGFDVGDIVLCKVNGHDYLHLIKAIGQDGRCQIANNKGHTNGWCSPCSIFGLVIRVEP